VAVAKVVLGHNPNYKGEGVYKRVLEGRGKGLCSVGAHGQNKGAGWLQKKNGRY